MSADQFDRSAEIQRDMDLVLQALDRIVLLGQTDPALLRDVARDARRLIEEMDDEADNLALEGRIVCAQLTQYEIGEVYP